MSEAKTKTVIARKGKATELSRKVADVLMNLRRARQMSQRAFADHIGVSFQQYQKYEKGRDRLSLEKAMMLCQELELPLGVFMLGDEENETQVIDIQGYGFSETAQQGFASSRMETAKRTADPAKSAAHLVTVLAQDEKELLAIFARIPKKSRQDFLETVRQLAKMTATKA